MEFRRTKIFDKRFVVFLLMKSSTICLINCDIGYYCKYTRLKKAAVVWWKKRSLFPYDRKTFIKILHNFIGICHSISHWILKNGERVMRDTDCGRYNIRVQITKVTEFASHQIRFQLFSHLNSFWIIFQMNRIVSIELIMVIERDKWCEFQLNSRVVIYSNVITSPYDFWVYYWRMLCKSGHFFSRDQCLIPTKHRQSIIPIY